MLRIQDTKSLLIGTLALVVSSLISSHAFSDNGIYKIVDEDGNVTYSSEPPETGQAVEVIEPLPAPAEEDVEAAKQRQRDIEEEFSRLDQQRTEQEFLEQEARRQNNTSVIQNTTVVVGSPGYRYGYHPGHPGYRPGFHPGIGRPGAPVAPGAPTAPDYRPPHAVPLPAGPHTRHSRRRRGP